MFLYNDSVQSYAFGFQDPASTWMIGMIELHDHVVFYLIIILVLVSWMLYRSLTNTNHLRYLNHGDLIEIIWTCIPAGILWMIGLPSLKLLYMMDEILDAEITVKATGYQWYWNYCYGDYSTNNNDGINFDSFMINDDDLELGDLRKLTVDNYLILPVNTSIRLIITSSDVMHSFAVPSLGVKVDAIPGRLNSCGFVINRETTLYGQCSELCGFNHSAMPIGIKAVSPSSYLQFLNVKLSE